MKKIILLSTIFGLLLSGAIAFAAADPLTDEDIASDNVFAPVASDLIEFTIDARWGYVRGNPSLEQAEKIYDGSITSSATSTNITFVKTLLFDSTDTIISSTNPVSWTSKIFGHWDGVLANVITKTDANITIKAGNFAITKTAADWFGQTTPVVQTGTGDQLLAIKISPKKHRRTGAIIWWGKKDQTGTSMPVDFSGSLIMDTNLAVKLQRTLRFEANDNINEQDRSHLTWTSTISTDRDGLYTLLLPNRDIAMTSGFTLTFDVLPGGWSKHFSLADIQQGVRQSITINGTDYVVLIGKKHIVNQLVKAQLSRRLYLIQDDIKHEVDNDDILIANGFKESQAVLMNDDELETYDTGDYLGYPNGTVVQDETNIYVIDNGQSRRLITPNILKRLLENNRLAPRRISQLRLNRLPVGPEIINPDALLDGSLLKIPGSSAVWRINGDKRQVFTQNTIFKLNRLNFDRVKTVTQEDLQKYNWAPPVPYPDGALVKIQTDPKVYLLQNGQRHWIETEADLIALGYKFSDIVDMPPTDITYYPEGDSVVTD